MKIIFVLLFVLLVSVILSEDPSTEEREWDRWKAKYEKKYPNEEEDDARRRAWQENADYVAAHNARDDVTYKLEMNMFADELQEGQGDPVKTEEMYVFRDELAPKHIDWRGKGVVTPVKDQGMSPYVEEFVAADPATEEKEWDRWKANYEKKYPNEEEDDARRRAWQENADYVAAHNAREDVTYKLEMNMFADELHAGQGDPVKTEEVYVFEDESAPKHFDWRGKGVVTPVKDQGMSGYVEAFVAAECVESFHAINTGHLYELSVEEVGNCCGVSILELPIVDDVFGCIHNIGGLCLNGTYGGKGQCDNSSCKAVAQTTGTKHVPTNDEGALLQAVLKVPVFADINASLKSFQLYKSGIYTDPQCVGPMLDHVLQVVGYGSDDKGNLYWICRNSWGTNWGMGGYILLQRGVNRCGIAEAAKYPY